MSADHRPCRGDAFVALSVPGAGPWSRSCIWCAHYQMWDDGKCLGHLGRWWLMEAGIVRTRWGWVEIGYPRLPLQVSSEG